MAVLTGADGKVMVNGAQILKARDYTISVAKDSLETSTLGIKDRTFVEGLRGATGSMTILYDPKEDKAGSLLQSILTTDGTTQEVEFVFTTQDNKKSLTYLGFITSVSQSVSTGAVQAASCNFQISGPVQDGGF